MAEVRVRLYACTYGDTLLRNIYYSISSRDYLLLVVAKASRQAVRWPVSNRNSRPPRTWSLLLRQLILWNDDGDSVTTWSEKPDSSGYEMTNAEDTDQFYPWGGLVMHPTCTTCAIVSDENAPVFW